MMYIYIQHADIAVNTSRHTCKLLLTILFTTSTINILCKKTIEEYFTQSKLWVLKQFIIVSVMNKNSDFDYSIFPFCM